MMSDTLASRFLFHPVLFSAMACHKCELDFDCHVDEGYEGLYRSFKKRLQSTRQPTPSSGSAARFQKRSKHSPHRSTDESSLRIVR